jgi:hypothetical protein
MSAKPGRNKKSSRSGDGVEIDARNEATGTNHAEPYTKNYVLQAIKRVCTYLERKAGNACCLNIDNKVTGTCACVFHILENQQGNVLRSQNLFVAGEIVSWFDSTAKLEKIAERKKDPIHFLTEKFVKCVEAEPINNGQQYTKRVNINILPGENKPYKEGTWYGHDWDVTEDWTGLKMCVPTVLLLWKVLIGGKDWEDTTNGNIKEWKKKITNGYLSMPDSSQSRFGNKKYGNDCSTHGWKTTWDRVV